MSLKKLFLIFSLLLLSSCVTFRPIPTLHITINGTFTADYRGDTFNGFFSLSGGNLRMDIVNSFGFSVYGLYVESGKIFIKDYQTGETYNRISVNGMNLNKYKSTIIYIARNFTKLCNNKTGRNIFLLRCIKIKGLKLPVDLILKAGNARLRIWLKNIKVVRKG